MRKTTRITLAITVICMALAILEHHEKKAGRK